MAPDTGRLRPPPRALSLDAGGVLLLPDPDRIRAALRPVLAAGSPTRPFAPSARIPTDEQLVAAHYAGMAAFDRPAPSPAERTARYRAAYARALGVRGPDLRAVAAALRDCFAEPGLWSAPAPGARAVVRLLARSGLPIVVVSNTEHGDVAALLRAAGIWPEPTPLDPSAPRSGGAGTVGRPGARPGTGVLVVDSTRAGVAKPDPRIFRIAIGALGVAPDDLVHVGDSAAADVAGARAAGIRALHLDPLDRCPDRGHGHLAALAELLARLESPPARAAAAGESPVSRGRGSGRRPRAS